MFQLKKTHKAIKTREGILKAALTLFRDKGYDRTSMRDISKQAGVAVGAAYYYFRTKDEMILEFYARSQREADARNQKTCENTRSFRERISDLLTYRLNLLEAHRELFVVLTRSGIDPANPLSPFASETAHLREAATALIQNALEGSDLKISGQLKPYLPRLLWFFQMGLILFWALDTSEKQSRTRRLLTLSLDLMIPLFGMSMLPLAGIFNRMVIEIHDLMSGMIRNNKTFTESPDEQAG